MIIGDDGDNTIEGRGGADRICGGGGDDQISVGAPDGDPTHVLFAKGGKGNDTIDGSDYDDRLFGGDGADTIYGWVGNDDISGEAGPDTLFGGPGYDDIDGGEGADRRPRRRRLLRRHGRRPLRGGDRRALAAVLAKDGGERVEPAVHGRRSAEPSGLNGGATGTRSDSRD